MSSSTYQLHDVRPVDLFPTTRGGLVSEEVFPYLAINFPPNEQQRALRLIEHERIGHESQYIQRRSHDIQLAHQDRIEQFVHQRSANERQVVN